MSNGTRKTKSRMHLLGFVLNGVVNHTQGIWKHPKHHRSDPAGFARPAFWQELGQTLERGKFDALFIADVLAPYTNFRGNSDSAFRHAVQCPVHDPAALVPVVGTATSKLGIGLTLSTSFVPPYHLVRQLSTLEHLTQYRVGWNIVTSYARAEFAAMGMDGMVNHDERYARADEFLEICYRLWDAWGEGAVRADAASGEFIDPARVGEVSFDGKYMRCHTRPYALPLEPHRRPVLWQAGGSKTGRDFAARHADSVFHVAPNARTMRAYVDDMRSRFVGAGRRADDIKIIFGTQVVVAPSRAEAQEKYAAIAGNIELDATLTIMSGHFGLDFARFDPDADMRAAGRDPAVEGAVGQLEAILSAGDPNQPLTIRNAADIYGISCAAPILIGTPTDIADQLEQLFDDGGGDGFMVFSTYLPDCYGEFVDLVVPELQHRGRFRKAYSGSTLRHHLTEY